MTNFSLTISFIILMPAWTGSHYKSMNTMFRVVVLLIFFVEALSLRPPPSLLRLLSKPDEAVDITLVNVPTIRGNESLSVKFTDDVALAQFLRDTHSLGLLPEGSSQIHTSLKSLNTTLPHELYHLPGTPGILKPPDSFSQQFVQFVWEAIGCIAFLVTIFVLQYMLLAM